MKSSAKFQVFIFCLGGLLCSAGAAELTLKASKDTFGRSQERNRNSGASTVLYVAHAPSVRAVVSYDLSSVTNRIRAARFRFHQKTSMPRAILLTIAPMVQTAHNDQWLEGSGALGARGQNARPGESCYDWSAFPAVAWENSTGLPVADLGAEGLWGAPLVANRSQPWEDGAWVEIQLTNPGWLETIRQSKQPVLTLGLWGTGGNGMYAFASKESGRGPELILVTEEQKGEGK